MDKNQEEKLEAENMIDVKFVVGMETGMLKKEEKLVKC